MTPARLIFSTVLFSFAIAAQTRVNQLLVIPQADSSQVGSIQFFSKDHTHKISLMAPDTVGTDYSLTLPASDSQGCWQSDGAGHIISGPCGGANSLVISDSNPLYLYSHFRDDDAGGLYYAISLDGNRFRDIRADRSVSTELTRDPSIAVIPDSLNSAWKFVTVTSPNFDATYSLQIFKSNDLVSFNGAAGQRIWPFRSRSTCARIIHRSPNCTHRKCFLIRPPAIWASSWPCRMTASRRSPRTISLTTRTPMRQPTRH